MNYKTTSLSFTELPKPPKPAVPTVQMFRLVCQCNITRSSIDPETMLHTKPVLPVFCVKCRKEYDIQPCSVSLDLYDKKYLPLKK